MLADQEPALDKVWAGAHPCLQVWPVFGIEWQGYRSIQHHSRVLCPDLDDMLSVTLLISSQSKSVSSSDYSRESVASCLPDVMYGHSDPILVGDRGICR